MIDYNIIKEGPSGPCFLGEVLLFFDRVFIPL